jgi:hypothetical protein
MTYLAHALYRLTAREVKTPVSAPNDTAGNIELKNEFQDFDFMASPVVVFLYIGLYGYILTYIKKKIKWGGCGASDSGSRSVFTCQNIGMAGTIWIKW